MILFCLVSLNWLLIECGGWVRIVEFVGLLLWLRVLLWLWNRVSLIFDFCV